jgi:hypothetical protein
MGKFQNMDLVYRRAIKMGDAIRNLMGKDPLNNCPILEDSTAEPEVMEQLHLNKVNEECHAATGKPTCSCF